LNKLPFNGLTVEGPLHKPHSTVGRTKPRSLHPCTCSGSDLLQNSKGFIQNVDSRCSISTDQSKRASVTFFMDHIRTYFEGHSANDHKVDYNMT
jgi:hypothetical protein